MKSFDGKPWTVRDLLYRELAERIWNPDHLLREVGE